MLRKNFLSSKDIVCQESQTNAIFVAWNALQVFEVYDKIEWEGASYTSRYRDQEWEREDVVVIIDNWMRKVCCIILILKMVI